VRGTKKGRTTSECYSEKMVEKNANFVAKEETENNDVVLLANKENRPEKENVWYLDTGANNHMCGYKYMFTELKETSKCHIFFDKVKRWNSKVYFKCLLCFRNEE
jgi:hypothetical protein